MYTHETAIKALQEHYKYQDICNHQWYKPYVNENKRKCSLCDKTEEPRIIKLCEHGAEKYACSNDRCTHSIPF